MCTYEKFPTVPVPYSMLAGYGAIAAELARALAGKQRVLLVVDGYPGTRFDEIVAGLMEELFFALRAGRARGEPLRRGDRGHARPQHHGRPRLRRALLPQPDRVL